MVKTGFDRFRFSVFFRFRFRFRFFCTSLVTCIKLNIYTEKVLQTDLLEKRRMGKISLSLLLAIVVCILGFTNAAYESPQYKVIHTESDYEIRLYSQSSWMTAPVSEISFRKATIDGFHRLFQYIEGANLNNSRVSMTVPVLTNLIPGAGPLDSSAYVVYFYLPEKYKSSPPLPLPELNLSPDSWPTSCKAVRKFSGFARDKNVVEEAKKLANSLSMSQYSTSSSSNVAYSVAQYNSPLKFFGRVNEVWVDVDGCEDAKVAAY